MTEIKNMQPTINWYSFDKKLKIVERGAAREEEALAIIDDYYANIKTHYDTAEEAIVQTSFGFQKSKSEFIEISFVTTSNIMFKYETSVPGKILFLSIPKIIQKERTLHSKEELQEMVLAFYAMDTKTYLAHLGT